MKINNYYKPTPKKLRKLGDALLAVSAFVVGFSAIQDVDWLLYTSLAIGVLGKFFTNFFAEETNKA